MDEESGSLLQIKLSEYHFDFIVGHFLFFFIIMLFFAVPLWAYADEEVCPGGTLVLVEDIADQWGYPEPNYTYKTLGRSMGFWEQPTSCSEIVYEGGYILEYTKRLACVHSVTTGHK